MKGIRRSAVRGLFALVTIGGLVGRVLATAIAGTLVWLIVNTVLTSGRPGTLVVTLVYVAVDVSVQYLLGLGLALLVVQHLPGRRFFRVVFLLPSKTSPQTPSAQSRMRSPVCKRRRDICALI